MPTVQPNPDKPSLRLPSMEFQILSSWLVTLTITGGKFATQKKPLPNAESILFSHHNGLNVWLLMDVAIGGMVEKTVQQYPPSSFKVKRHH